jgi:hypothetical protein
MSAREKKEAVLVQEIPGWAVGSFLVLGRNGAPGPFLYFFLFIFFFSAFLINS